MALRKVLIPAAGRGTRFLPATKSVPKEMLPIVDRPLIQYAVEEAVAAGIDHVVLITTAGKESVEEHFLPDPELERALERSGKHELLAQVRHASGLATISTALQEVPRGVGHAVLQGKEQIGGEAFAVMFPDDLILGDPPVLEQLRRVWAERPGIVLAVQQVPHETIHRYGVIDAERVDDAVWRVRDLVEKPPVDDAPSDLAIVGRYVLVPEIFAILEETAPGVGGEIQLTDALRTALGEIPCHAVVFQGDRYDCGAKGGFLEATVAAALRHGELGQDFRRFLQELSLTPAATTAVD